MDPLNLSPSGPSYITLFSPLSTFSIWLLQMTSEAGWGGLGVASQTHAVFDLCRLFQLVSLLEMQDVSYQSVWV